MTSRVASACLPENGETENVLVFTEVIGCSFAPLTGDRLGTCRPAPKTTVLLAHTGAGDHSHSFPGHLFAIRDRSGAIARKTDSGFVSDTTSTSRMMWRTCKPLGRLAGLPEAVRLTR
jgi:hypothetical protein